MFPIGNDLKQGDVSSLMLFNFVLGYAIMRVQVNEDDLKLNVTHQFLVYADDFNVEVGSVHTTQKKALTVASKEIGLEVNADKIKYMVMFRDQNAGRSHNMEIDNRCYKMVGKFKYVGTTLTDKNSIREETKRRLKSGNACYHSVRTFCLPACNPKILKIKIYKTKILLVVLYGCET
jgi:hypothetical protein